MPHKQGTKTIYKHSGGYVHPSLQSLNERPEPASKLTTPTSSVNEKINHLRRTQTPRIYAGDDIPPPVIQVATSSNTRRPAGPEPQSWSTSRQTGIPLADNNVITDITLVGRSRRLDQLPGIRLPKKNSLVHIAMKHLAVNFRFHLEYDHVFLSTLPIELKSILLSYIATYASAQNLVSISALRLLLGNDLAAEKETHSDSLERLDLSSSIGHSITLKELQKYWTTPVERRSGRTPDSWEDEEIPRSISTTRFPTLTRLSLACPPTSISWSALLSLSRCLRALTHLSLAYWPTPRLPIEDNSITSPPSTIPPNRSLRGLYRDPEAWEEAGVILKQLSRNTPSLRWLSFEGCSAWFRALRQSLTASSDASDFSSNAHHDGTTTFPLSDGNGTISLRFSRPIRTHNAAFITQTKSAVLPAPPKIGPEWTHAWRHVTYVNMKHGAAPPGTAGASPSAMRALHALGATSSVLRQGDGSVPAWMEPDSERSRLSDLGEFYVINAPNDDAALSIKAPYERKLWWDCEREAARVALEVRRARTRVGGPWCVFDFGWGE